LRSNYITGKKNLVGPKVREARLRTKPRLTQSELSARLETLGLHIDRAGISKIENQDRIVTDTELVGLARALKVNLPWLLECK
jgi:transcriptional regulator with XRE-family HTH domain